MFNGLFDFNKFSPLVINMPPAFLESGSGAVKNDCYSCISKLIFFKNYKYFQKENVTI